MADQLVGVEIRGLREFRQKLNSTDRSLSRAVARDLRAVAAITALEARSLAASRTTSRTGDLIRGIRPFATVRGAGVRSTASHGGYPYPRRLEFEGRRGAETGPRASLFPAFRRTQPQVIAAGKQLMEGVLRDLQ